MNNTTSVNLIEKIIASLNKNLIEKGNYVQLNDSSCTPIKIDKTNFHEIESVKSKKRIVFIDGGNVEILKAPNFSLQLIRIYYAIYIENKKTISKKQEFYSLINAVNKENRIVYKTEFFGIDKIDKDKLDKLTKLEFDSFDETIRQGKHRITISAIGNIVRRFMDLEKIKNLIEKLDEQDIILIDGDLNASITGELAHFNELYKKAAERNVIISALSKTSELFTEKGNALIPILNELVPAEFNKEWYYHPLVEINNQNQRVAMYIVKLNKNAKHIFKFEIFNGMAYNINEVLDIIRNNSKDPVFFGYPYGLIEVDRFARVSNKEKEYFKTLFLAKLGKDNKQIINYLNLSEAHDILDSISY